MPKLRIRPISTGRFMEFEKSVFTYGLNQGVKIEAPILMWFIEGAENRILVDSGVSDPEWALRHHRTIVREEHEDPLNAIARLGLKPEDIDIIVNTHLHWDHCFNNHLFPNARILVQAEELRYAIAPLPCHALPYEAQVSGMTPPWIRAMGRIEVVEGEMEIEEGILLVPLPGHTPGFHGVLVDLQSGPCLIAGDACPLFQNWDGDGQAHHIPPGIHVDLRDCYGSFRKMEALAGMVLPGHDLRVLKNELYG
jgi:N-acyl homoserine lactone hydrolase